MTKPVDLKRKFSIESPFEWLTFCPKRYIDFSQPITKLREFFDGEPVVFRGVLEKKVFYDHRNKVINNPMIAKSAFISLLDEDLEKFQFRVFGRPGFVWKPYKAGDVITVSATMKLHEKYGVQPSSVSIVEEDNIGKLVSVYPPVSRTAGGTIKAEVIKAATLENLVTAGQYIDRRVLGWDEMLVKATGFRSAENLVACLHKPETVRQGDAAVKAARIANGIALVRQARAFVEHRVDSPKSSLVVPEKHIEIIKSLLPYPLTPCQDVGVREIVAGLREPVAFNAVLSGDVGTGKTLTFGIPAILAASNGALVVIVVPNMLLVEQISAELREISKKVPILKVTADGVIGELGENDAGIAIGTTAVDSYFSKKKRGKRQADFLIIDEQHKFSVAQRERLAGPHTNILESSATPTPRSAALIIHGGRQVIRLETCPVEKHIVSRFYPRHEIKEFAAKLREVIASGEQMAIVYPLVEENEESDLISIGEAYEKMKKFVPQERIAVLHGRMTDAEKFEAIEALKRKEKDLLICSTAVEVGVTMPHLKHLAVYAPEVFGVSALHQLRGRLARKGGRGDFYMVAGSDSLAPDTLDRIELLTKYSNGFDLAEQDSKRRGFGDILNGSSQNGASIFLFKGLELTPDDLAFAQRIVDGEDVSRQEIDNHLKARGENLSLVG